MVSVSFSCMVWVKQSESDGLLWYSPITQIYFLLSGKDPYKECKWSIRRSLLFDSEFISEISSYFSKYKTDYFICFGKKHADSSRSIKSYWATLRTLLNGKKVPSILPLLVNKELITEFEAMANICNKYYPSQCTKINHNSALPSTLNNLTDDKLSSLGTFLQMLFFN